MANKKNKRITHRRSFIANQHTLKKRKTNSDNGVQNIREESERKETTGESSETPIVPTHSRSSAKLDESIQKVLEGDNNDVDDFFFVMNFKIMKNVIETYATCPECRNDNVALTHLNNVKNGYALCFQLECKDCLWENKMFSSPSISMNDDRDNRGKKTFEANTRAVIAFRELGKGNEGMKRFNTLFNMPPPLSRTSYNDLTNVLHDIYKESAEESMTRAANEVRNIVNPEAAPEEIIDTTIAIDGSWQKRGYSSLNGVITGISPENCKVIDCSVFSKFCKACSDWESKKDTPEYIKWEESHEESCSINHTKSSGAMETSGAELFFSRSIEKHSLRYSHYLGDGDTDSFQKIKDSKPYGKDFIIAKAECVGHVQKRCGTRLRNLRSNFKGKKLTDGKGLTGRGRLTDKVINKMQNYYGMAIRQNSFPAWNNDREKALYAMKKCVVAILWHFSDLDVATRHQFCPRTPDSWCKYWKSGQEKFSTNLPEAIMLELKPTFLALRNDDLLSRCLDSMTQNPNEAFNQLIWKRCPKDVFVSKEVLEIGTYSAIVNYNEGVNGLDAVFAKLNLSFGKFSREGAVQMDTWRVKKLDIKETEKFKKARKRNRAIRKGFIDREKESEGGDSYSSGNF